MSVFPSIQFVIRQSTKKGFKGGKIQCQVFLSNEQYSFSTGIQIENKLWDKKQKQPKQSVSAEAQKTARILSQIRSDLQNIFNEELTNGNKLSPAQMCAIYKARKNQKKPREKTILDVADDLILDRRGGVSKKTLYEYTHFKKYWQEFLDFYGLSDLKPNEINAEIAINYKSYFRDVKEHSWSTIYDRYFKILKAVLKHARILELSVNQIVFEKLKRPRDYSVKRIYLLREEREYLESLFKNGQASDMVMLIILAIHTGLRHVDLAQISLWQTLKSNKNKSNLALQIRDKKENNKCFIPITKTALRILKNFDFAPNFMTNQGFNRALKRELGKHEIFLKPRRLEGFDEPIILARDLSAHGLRRTFVNFLLESRIPKEQIMMATGHKTESVFEIYADHMNAASDSFIQSIANID